jgi:hypothetical protein
VVWDQSPDTGATSPGGISDAFAADGVR